MSFADSAATHCTQKKESSGSLVTHVADPASLGRALDARRQTVHVKTAVTLVAEQQLVVVVRRAWGIGCVITYKRTRWNRTNHRTINTRTDTRNQEKPLNLHRYFYFKQKKRTTKEHHTRDRRASKFKWKSAWSGKCTARAMCEKRTYTAIEDRWERNVIKSVNLPMKW